LKLKRKSKGKIMAEVDIATLGIKVDAGTADVAADKLDNLTKSGERAEASSKGVASASNQMRAAIMAAIGAINANTNSMGAFTDRLNNNKTASRGAAAAVDDMEARVSKLRASVDPMGAAISRVNMELAEARLMFDAGSISAAEYARSQTILNARINEFQRRQGMMNAAMGIGARSAKLQSYEMLNLSRQFADIGVTAAMGMNPLMILVQQGPQIADVLATARSRGISTADAFRQMGSSILPWIGRLAPFGVAAALAFGTLSLAAHHASENVGNVQKEFGLTEKQMDRLKDKGTDLGFTMSDVAAGVASAIADAFELDDIIRAWNRGLNYLGDDAYSFAENVVGIFGGMVGAVKAAFSDIPRSLAAVFIAAMQLYLNTVNDMVRRGTNVINGFLNMLPDWVGVKGNLKAPQIDVPDSPLQGQMDKITGGFEAGDKSARAAFRSGMASHRRSRILEDAGDPEKGRKPRKPRESQEERDWKKAIEGAEAYIKALREATKEMGLNEVQAKQLATSNAQVALEEAAHKAQLAGLAVDMKKVHNLTLQMSQAQEEWEQKLHDTSLRDLRRELTDMADAEEYETRLLGMNNEARERARAQREIDIKLRDYERRGIHLSAEEIEQETQRILENASARGRRDDIAQGFRNTATAANDMADAVRDATESFGELFGTAGQGYADLMNTLMDYNAAQADSAAQLAELQRQYGENYAQNAQYQFEAGRIQQQQSQQQIALYGNMLHAAKGFFKEGSTGWKIMEAAERAYRIFQFAMMIRSIIMDKTHTASSVANSGARAAADGVAAVAKAIASLPFPLNLIAGAATLAFLVAIGVKMVGKGGGKGASAVAEEKQKTESYTGPTDRYGAPTSYYSVLRPGDTTVAGNRSAPGYMQNGVQVQGGDIHLTVEGDMADNTLNRLVPILQQHQDDTVNKAREAVANDFATRSGRQSIGGSV
jgi:hypothetical protein